MKGTPIEVVNVRRREIRAACKALADHFGRLPIIRALEKVLARGGLQDWEREAYERALVDMRAPAEVPT